MAVTKKALQYNIRGASLEIGTFTLDPAALAADTSVEETVALAGAATTDLLFVMPKNITDGLVLEGAWISSAAVATLQIHNTTEAEVDGVSTTFQYILVKVSSA